METLAVLRPAALRRACTAHDAVQFCLYGFHLALVSFRKQGEQIRRACAEVCSQAAVRCAQRGGFGCVVVFQPVLGQRAVGAVPECQHALRALGASAAFGGEEQCRIPGCDGEAQRLLRAGSQLVKFRFRHSGQAFGREGGRLTDISQRRNKRRAEAVRQLGNGGLAEQHKVFAPWRERAHGVGDKGVARVHQTAVLQYVAPGQRAFAPLHQIGQDRQERRLAALVVFEHYDVALGGQRHIQILQKKLFLCGGWVQRQIHPGDIPADEHAAPGQFLCGGTQTQMLACVRRTGDEESVARAFTLVAHHIRPLERDDQLLKIIRLTQYGSAQRFGQPVEALQPRLAPRGGVVGQGSRGRLLCGPAGKAAHFRSLQLTPDAVDVLQRAAVQGLDLLSLARDGLVQRRARAWSCALQSLQLPRGVCSPAFYGGKVRRGVEICPGGLLSDGVKVNDWYVRLGARVLPRGAAGGCRGPSRRGAALRAPAARGRLFRFRLQRQTWRFRLLPACRLPAGAQCARTEHAVQQIVDIVFHDAPLSIQCTQTGFSKQLAACSAQSVGRDVIIIPVFIAPQQKLIRMAAGRGRSACPKKQPQAVF